MQMSLKERFLTRVSQPRLSELELKKIKRDSEKLIDEIAVEFSDKETFRVSIPVDDYHPDAIEKVVVVLEEEIGEFIVTVDQKMTLRRRLQPGCVKGQADSELSYQHVGPVMTIEKLRFPLRNAM
jgi:hypothetical protein